MGLLPFEKMQREVLVREESPAEYGLSPEERPLSEVLQKGIVVLDKPSGPTSHQAADFLKRILKIDKAGHSGTLDPAVTGVLPVALKDATRITHALLSSGKEYVCEMHLHGDHSEEEIRDACKAFEGKIKQLPPVKSAIKRQLRYRKVYYLEILEISGREVLFLVGCQAGTYIRKLCHDIGEKLGTGAHMAQLRRTKAGPFREEHAVTLQTITDAYHYYTQGNAELLKKIILPIESAIGHLGRIWVHDSTIASLTHGVSLKMPGIAKVETDIQAGEEVAVLTLKGELVLVGEVQATSKELLTKERGVAVKPKQVFMR